MFRAIKQLRKRILRKYNKLAETYGGKRALIMGISYAFYKVFGMLLIKLLKKCIRHVKPNRLIFESKPDYSDNGRALSDYMVENGYNRKYKIIWLVAEPRDFKKYKTKNVKFVLSEGRWHKQRTVRAYYYSLTAKYVFFTHAFKWVKKKLDGQIYVNLWHGCGYKASRRREGDENVFDYCLATGDVYVKKKSEFFGCPEDRVLTLGCPRYDLYKRDNPHVEEYFASLSTEKRKNILWMPTFVQSKDLIYYENPIPAIMGLPLINSVNDFARLEEICRETNVNLIIKSHRIGRKPQFADDEEKAEEGHVFYLNDDKLKSLDIQLYELLPKTDALITDFSSVAIDYILLEKPMAFTLDSFDDYARTRGFAFHNPKEFMPGEHVYNLEELKEFLLHVNEGIDNGKKQRDKILHKTHNKTSDYCKRILDYFNLESGI